jgi:hypothetical protein
MEDILIWSERFFWWGKLDTATIVSTAACLTLFSIPSYCEAPSISDSPSEEAFALLRGWAEIVSSHRVRAAISVDTTLTYEGKTECVQAADIELTYDADTGHYKMVTINTADTSSFRKDTASIEVWNGSERTRLNRMLGTDRFDEDAPKYPGVVYISKSIGADFEMLTRMLGLSIMGTNIFTLAHTDAYGVLNVSNSTNKDRILVSNDRSELEIDSKSGFPISWSWWKDAKKRDLFETRSVIFEPSGNLRTLPIPASGSLSVFSGGAETMYRFIVKSMIFENKESEFHEPFEVHIPNGTLLIEDGVEKGFIGNSAPSESGGSVAPLDRVRTLIEAAESDQTP